MSGKRLALVFLSLGAVAMQGCASSKPDPRSTIIAPNASYRARLAKSVNGSEFWRAYFEEVAPEGSSAQPVVKIHLQMDRVVTFRGSGGDYDPGTVKIVFEAVNLRTGRQLYREKKQKKLDSVIFGLFDENATREDIQRIAFESAEEDVFPFIDRWVNISAIRAMSHEGTRGTAFVSLLEEQTSDAWAEDLRSEARLALKSIQGAR